MQTRRVIASVSTAFALGLTLTSCSGSDSGDAGRPSAQEVADVLSSDEGFDELDISDEQLTCVSEAYVDSDLSDEALQALIDGDDEYVPSEEDETVLSELILGAAGECFLEG